MDRPDDDLNSKTNDVRNDDEFYVALDTEIELTHHNGTVRDLIFMHDNLTDDSILLSGGAGDCKIYVTDVKKQTPIKSFNGHQGKSQ